MHQINANNLSITAALKHAQSFYTSQAWAESSDTAYFIQMLSLG